ncbi:MAG: PhzF family phenazine biosynthesis protein [Haloarculaceae archaeon]
MDTRSVVLVDAFAAEPTGGAPVAVCPDGTDLTDSQLRAVARELAAPATAMPTDGVPDRLRAVGPRGRVDPGAVAVGALGAGLDRGWIETGTYALTVAGDASGGGEQDPTEVTVAEDGCVWVALDEPNPQSAGPDLEDVAGALGVPVAALRDVGADLPPVRLSADVDTLAVPVNFLEHLGTASPDPGALADLTATADVGAVCAFTFDTLSAAATCHARTVAPGWTPDTPGPWTRTVGVEAPVTPAVWAGIAVHLTREGVVEDDQPLVEGGHYLDRPARVRVDPVGIRVGGRAVTTLDGTVTVPPSEDDEILEL